MSDGTVRRHIIKKALIAVAPIEEKVEVILASDYDTLLAQAVEMAQAYLLERRSSWIDILDDEESVNKMMEKEPLCQQAQALLEAQP